MDRVMMNYLPPVLRAYGDYSALMARYQEAFDLFWDLARETESDMFLMTAGERGLGHWEEMAGISPGDGDAMELRRQRIVGHLSRVTPYSWRALLTFLTMVLGSEEAYTAVLRDLTLEIWIMPAWRDYADAVDTLVRQMVPANVATEVVSVYNSHRQLSRLTHRQLGAYSHMQLSSEVSIFE